MLVSEIITLAESQCQESSYTTGEWISLFNLCQDDLTPYAKIKTTAEDIAVTVTSNKTSIVLANDSDLATAHEILNVHYTPASGSQVEMRRLRTSDKRSKGWKLDSTTLYLQGLGSEASGTVDVDFYQKLTHCTYVESPESYTPSSPEIPDEYHGIYVSFLCGKSQQREEENEDMSIFMSEYNQAKQNFALERVKIMEPWNFDKIKAQQQTGGA